MRGEEGMVLNGGVEDGIISLRPYEWVLQFIVLIAGYSIHSTWTNSLRNPLNLDSEKGSVHPFWSSANSPPISVRRRLSQGDFFSGNHFGLDGFKKETQDFFAPNPDFFGSTSALAEAKLPEAFYPFNLSGSYSGIGWMNYSDNVLPHSVQVSTALRIRTWVASSDDDRYHVAQIRLTMNPTGKVDLTPGHSANVLIPTSWTGPDARLMLEATGTYDTYMGHMQAVTNDPLHPPDLPVINVTYADLEWPITSKAQFVPSDCQFLIDVFPLSITEDEFKKEQAGRNKDEERNNQNVNWAYSAILDREYIDVHMKATIQNLNQSCINMTHATTEVDLLRYDIFILKAIKYALVATCFSFLQLLLLFRQVQYSTSTVNASKLSLTSVAMNSVFDAYVCLIHLTAGLYIDDLFNSFIMVSFVQFMVFSMFDLRLVLLVWSARNPHDFRSGWERMRATVTKIYTGFYGGIFLCVVFLYYVRHQMKLFVFLIFAFWVPQIVRNAKTGEKFALQERFLLGVSAIRLFFPLYAFGCPRNFFEFQTNFVVVFGLIVFVGLQVFILRGQNRWGTRFFIPKRFQPDYYEYHRTFQIDPDDDEKCAICMDNFIEDPDVETITNSAEKTKVSFVEKDLSKKVLTTPCNHHFCRECLTHWMETKMICPTCRQPLPPYNL